MKRSLRNAAILATTAAALSTSGAQLSWRSEDQHAAREQLRLRGAVVTVFSGGDVVVDFPMGKHEIQRRRRGFGDFVCGFGMEQRLVPDEQSVAMRDGDLVYLDRLRGLTQVNLGGTDVSEAAVRSFRARHRRVAVEAEED